MDFNLITGLSYWYILLCILAGVVASLLLYFRDRKNEFPSWLKRVLGIIRFIVVGLVSFLLLSPLIKITTHYTEKPIVVIAQDNSGSLLMGRDSAYFRDSYRTELNQMLAQLGDDYELRLFTFGEKLNPVEGNTFDSLSFDEKYTDIAELYGLMDVRFVNRNVGALLIASDGIYNKGMNPRYHSGAIEYPVYTIALGDTSLRRDAYLKRVRYNKIAFQGNDFPVEAIVNASKMDGRTLSIRLMNKGTLVERQQLAVEGNNFSKTIRFNVSTDAPGMHHFSLLLSSNTDEVSKENNRYDIFVDVLSSKQKVLILYNSPHPDVSALKESIGSNANYEVLDEYAPDFYGPLEEYSLIILHQIPSMAGRLSQLYERVKRSGAPLLYIVGEQSNLSAFGGRDQGIQMTAYNQAGMNEALPAYNEPFTLFLVDDAIKDLIGKYPPLNAPFARYNVSNAGGILLYQQIGAIISSDPLWMFNGNQDRKTGLILGTGIWRWRLRTWLETGGHDAFNELINKTVQYLSLKDDKRRFRVFTKENLLENEVLEFNAELYNESLEPYNEPDVKLVIRDEDQNTYDFLFNKKGQAYALQAGNFPVGTYSYNASTRIDDKVFVAEGGFVITPLMAEKLSLRADHGLLRALAEENGGEMITRGEMLEFAQKLDQSNAVKPLIHAERKFIEFIDILWILAAIVLLIAAEWFLRKWSGSY